MAVKTARKYPPLFRNNHCNIANKYSYSYQSVFLWITSAFSTTHQSEDFEEVQVGVQDVLDLLQLLLTHGAHGVADPVEAHAAGKEDESLQQGLAAGYVLQLKVGDAEGKLEDMEGKQGQSMRLSKNHNVNAQETETAATA